MRYLLTYATAAGNVEFARRGLSAADVRLLPPPHHLLEIHGLGELVDTTVNTKCGGEQQRVALAVAVSSGRACCSPTNPPRSWVTPTATPWST